MRSPLRTEELTCFISIHIMYFKLHRELCLTCPCTMEYTMCVLVTRWSCMLISQCWKGWCIGPIELTVCEILKGNFSWCSFSLTLDFMSSCPIMASNIFLGISACSGSASASLLKETGEVCNQGQSLQSPSPGSYILYVAIMTTSLRDWRSKLYFGRRFVV